MLHSRTGTQDVNSENSGDNSDESDGAHVDYELTFKLSGLVMQHNDSLIIIHGGKKNFFYVTYFRLRLPVSTSAISYILLKVKI